MKQHRENELIGGLLLAIAASLLGELKAGYDRTREVAQDALIGSRLGQDEEPDRNVQLSTGDRHSGSSRGSELLTRASERPTVLETARGFTTRAEEYFSATELAQFGVGECGKHVFVSRSAKLHHPEKIRFGSFVRIDGFSSLVAKEPIRIGSHVHIGTSVAINAAAPVAIGDFTGISAGTKLFTTDDDYEGGFLTGPTVVERLTNIHTAPVELREHCVVGANSVILPGALLEEGVVVGALSLVKGTLKCWGIYGGVPAKLLRPRSRDLLKKVPRMAADAAEPAS